MLEIFEYSRPYSYNHAPLRKSTGSYACQGERRIDNLYRARSNINRLVIANTNWKENAPRFVTFTFAKNITSLEEAHVYWRTFMRKFKIMFPALKYLGVVEFQKRGAVHYHVLFFNLPFKFGMKETIRNTWGQGFIKFKSASRLRKIDELGLYLSKYLQKEIMDMRLRGEKAYFCSKNLTRPIVYRDETTCSQLLSTIDENDATISSYQSKNFGVIKKITSRV